MISESYDSHVTASISVFNKYPLSVAPSVLSGTSQSPTTTQPPSSNKVVSRQGVCEACKQPIRFVETGKEDDRVVTKLLLKVLEPIFKIPESFIKQKISPCTNCSKINV